MLVAVHHATGYGFNAMFIWTDRYMLVEVPNYDQIGSLAYYAIIFIQQIDYFALPAFMFVSGFFAAFAAGNSAQLKWNIVKSRVWNLLIPFCIWSVVFFLLFVRRIPQGPDEILDRYYFIPLLIQFYLLAPFLMPLAKKRPKLVLVVAAGLELGRFTIHLIDKLGGSFWGDDILLMLTPRWLFPTLFFWFMLGAVAGFHRRSLSEWLGRKNMKWVLLGATIGLALLSLLEYYFFMRITGQEWLGAYFGGYSRQVYALAFILCFLAFGRLKLPFSSQISEMGTKSLGIYLIHGRIMYIAAVLMYRELPNILGYSFIYQMILIVVSLAGSILFMELIKKSPARPFYRYLFG